MMFYYNFSELKGIDDATEALYFLKSENRYEEMY